MANVVGALVAPGEAFFVAMTPDLNAAWPASYLAGVLESLPPQWADMACSVRVNGQAVGVGGVIAAVPNNSLIPAAVLLVPVNEPFGVPLTPGQLAAALNGMPAPLQAAMVYVQSQNADRAVTGARLFTDPVYGTPYVLEISSNPLLTPPVQ